MKCRMGPVRNYRYIAMVDRVKVHVVQMARIISLVPNSMLPKTSLPDATLRPCIFDFMNLIILLGCGIREDIHISTTLVSVNFLSRSVVMDVDKPVRPWDMIPPLSVRRHVPLSINPNSCLGHKSPNCCKVG